MYMYLNFSQKFRYLGTIARRELSRYPRPSFASRFCEVYDSIGVMV